MATSLWPVASGATSGRNDQRLVERSTSIGYDVRLRARPGHLQRPAAPLLLEVHHRHMGGIGGGELAGDDERVVGRGVVDDNDRPAVGEVGLEVGAEGGYGLRQGGLLVVNGDDGLDTFLAVRERVASLRPRYINHEVPSFLCWVLDLSLSLKLRAMSGL